MSATNLGWDLAMQTGDIISQLDHGVSALLIDTHDWDRSGTVEGADNEVVKEVIEASLADDQPRPGLWLCHGFCALGATELVPALADINFWLDAHPREVLLIIIQDEISTEDTFSAFDASGLLAKVHNHRPGTPFPTLQQLIDSNERILVYAENEGSHDSWYQNAWDEAFVDTPFGFGLRSEFSCEDEPRRGRRSIPSDQPLAIKRHSGA